MKDVAAPDLLRQPGQSRETAGTGKRRPRGWLTASIVIAVTAAAVATWRGGLFDATASPGHGPLGEPAPATQPVVRQNIVATTPLPASLGYAGAYTVTGRGSEVSAPPPRPVTV